MRVCVISSREDRVELCKHIVQTRKRDQGTAGTGWALQAMILAFAPWMLICLSLPATRDLGNSRIVDDSVAMVIPHDYRHTCRKETLPIENGDFEWGWNDPSSVAPHEKDRLVLKKDDGQV